MITPKVQRKIMYGGLASEVGKNSKPGTQHVTIAVSGYDGGKTIILENLLIVELLC